MPAVWLNGAIRAYAHVWRAARASAEDWSQSAASSGRMAHSGARDPAKQTAGFLPPFAVAAMSFVFTR
jgi:hypothetical protein